MKLEPRSLSAVSDSNRRREAPITYVDNAASEIREISRPWGNPDRNRFFRIDVSRVDWSLEHPFITNVLHL